MGLIGIIIASIVNIFIGLFGAAVRDLGDRRHRLRRPDRLGHAADQGAVLRVQYADGQTAGKTAIMGALPLYLDFINLFMMLLQFLGVRRD